MKFINESKVMSDRQKRMVLYESKQMTSFILTEDIDAATTKQVAGAVAKAMKEGDKKEQGEKLQAVVDNIPDDKIDDILTALKNAYGDMKISNEARKVAKEKGVDLGDSNRLDDFLNNENIQKGYKGVLLVVLWIISFIEPTPVGEIISLILTILPAKWIWIIAMHPLFIINAGIKAIARAIKKRKEKKAQKELQGEGDTLQLAEPKKESLRFGYDKPTLSPQKKRLLALLDDLKFYIEKDNEELIDKTLDKIIKVRQGITEDLEVGAHNHHNIDVPKTDEDFGISAILNDLIIDEWEAIDGYNSAIITLLDLGKEDAVGVLRDIVNEENIHIGQLEQVMKSVSPNANSINDGEQEAKDQLGDNEITQEGIVGGLLGGVSDTVNKVGGAVSGLTGGLL